MTAAFHYYAVFICIAKNSTKCTYHTWIFQFIVWILHWHCVCFFHHHHHHKLTIFFRLSIFITWNTQFTIRGTKYVWIQWKWRVQTGSGHCVCCNDAYQLPKWKYCAQRNCESHLSKRIVDTKTWPIGTWILHPIEGILVQKKNKKVRSWKCFFLANAT